MAYFVEQVPGAAHRRFVIGTLARDGKFYVDHTQISRPDGQEIERPAVVVRDRPAPQTEHAVTGTLSRRRSFMTLRIGRARRVTR